MADISTAEVREIRNALKEEFGPKLKFGVKRQHYSSVSIIIKKGNVDFSNIMRGAPHRPRPINQYHLEQYGPHATLFDKIVNVIKKAPGNAEGGHEWYDNSDAMTDYFDTGFYFNLEVGTWDNPYEFQG